MEDLVQQVVHWKSRLTVAAFNQADWLPPYQPAKKPPRWKDHREEESFYNCPACKKYGFGKVCPNQDQHVQDELDRLEEAKKPKRKKRSTWDIHYENKSWEEKLKEQAAEKERQNEEARAQGYDWKTAEGYVIPGPDFLPGAYIYAHEMIISDELWQSWTAQEKVDWVIRHG